ncbi:MAG: hypothetical protein M0C28_30620 [Candidatus Moduliflexus flocculans]|nr:hypothetical protein [Candidatus Moduliflexus flocculans]
MPEYNTVDATLWYFEAIRAYFTKTNDIAFLEEHFTRSRKDIIEWHIRGTRYQIHMDPLDGLLYAGEDGVQLTWMDAKVGDWVVTPRIGKHGEKSTPYGMAALLSMADFARLLRKPAGSLYDPGQPGAREFSKFWNEGIGDFVPRRH